MKTFSFLRKLRKLRRDPVLFFKDAMNNGRISGPVKKVAPSTRAGTLKSPFRYSVVCAVYGVDRYLDEFFKSITTQTLHFEQFIELIMVDDGSPDRSAEVIAKWRSRFPLNIHYVAKANGGQASARNLGLEHVTGQWVTFIDADDCVTPDYFERVDEALRPPDEMPLLATCKVVFYDEGTRRIRDAHPLRYLFGDGVRTTDFYGSARTFAMSAPATFFRTVRIRAMKLRFDERIRPNFEDAHFLNHYLAGSQGTKSVFVGSAKYLYRKRSDKSSSIDKTWSNPGLFTDVLEFGVLDLLLSYRRTHEKVPSFIQRVALYHMIWYIGRLMNDSRPLTILSEPQRHRFVELVDLIFSHIDAETIRLAEFAGVWQLQRVGMWGRFKKLSPADQIVYPGEVDKEQRLFKLTYYTNAVAFESFRYDGSDVIPIHAGVREHTFCDRPFVLERSVWLPLSPEKTLTVNIAGHAARIYLRPSQCAEIKISKIVELAESKPAARIGWHARASRAVMNLPYLKRRFADAWAFIDQDVRADDNAEHLYRFVRDAHPGINAWFILNRHSRDWVRLKREGFRLIACNGFLHRALMLHCRHLLSSHADGYISQGLRNRASGDRRPRFTFLQHGVIHNDLSQWLNQKNIDCFITTGVREFDEIGGDRSRYRFSAKEVVLCGLPRHDALLRANRPERCIVVAPTWRQSLVGSTIPGSSQRQINPGFEKSHYLLSWRALLEKNALPALAARFGYRIVFMPHSNIDPYLSTFALDSSVDFVSQRDGMIQHHLARGAVMITDYSSIAYEFALLAKPLIYYQFDAKQMRDGAHTIVPTDARTRGFGPVCETVEEMLTAVKDVLERGAVLLPEYVRRAETFFAYRDRQNCARVVAAVTRMEHPAPWPQLLPAQWAAYIETAAAIGEHGVVEQRRSEWRRLSARSVPTLAEIISVPAIAPKPVARIVAPDFCLKGGVS